MMSLKERKVAKRIVDDLFENLGDRRGFDISDIDSDVLDDWKSEWRMVVMAIIKDEGGMED